MSNSFATAFLELNGYDVTGENVTLVATNLRRRFLLHVAGQGGPSGAGPLHAVRFAPLAVLPKEVVDMLQGLKEGGWACAKVSLYCARLKRVVLPDERRILRHCGRLAADVTRHFDLKHGETLVNGFFCSECARRAPAEEKPDAVRLVEVWWEGMLSPIPLQLRLSGITAGVVQPDVPKSESDSDSDAEQPTGGGVPECINVELGGTADENEEVQMRRLVLNEVWSKWVWSRLCNPKLRTQPTV